MLAHKSTVSASRVVVSSAGKPFAAPSLASRSSGRANLQKACVATMVVEQEVETLAPPAYSEPVNALALNKRLEAKAKAIIALEEQEIATWPTVRVRLQKQIGLGEVWKIVGRVPELGRFAPAVAPAMKWSDGHVWTYEGRLRPGTWLFKLVLRRADNAYIWEEGNDRVLDIPETAGPDDVVELVVNDIKLESRRW